MTTDSFWSEKLGTTTPQPRQVPGPAIPQAEHEDETDDYFDVTDPANARKIETGSEVASISGMKNRSWETNSRKVSDNGIFGPLGRREKAAVNQAIKSGKFTEAGRGKGALGEAADPRDSAAAIAELSRDGSFDTPRGSLG